MAKRTIWLGAVLAAAALVGTAAAQDAITARQAEYKELGKRMGAIKDTVVDKKGGTLADVAANAEYIAGKLPQIPSWFPKGSEKGSVETWALPKIWEDPAGFEAAARNAQDLATKLVAAARSGDQAATTAAFATLGKEGCGGCHQPFRRPKS